MMWRWISLVPSQMRSTRASRHQRSAGKADIRPMPPKICTAVSVIRPSISEAYSLAIAASASVIVPAPSRAAMAKLYASEMLGRVTDAAVQIFGGMGLMGELPVERWWRDARVERIWDGTSEIQRHVISRSLLRPYGG